MATSHHLNSLIHWVIDSFIEMICSNQPCIPMCMLSTLSARNIWLISQNYAHRDAAQVTVFTSESLNRWLTWFIQLKQKNHKGTKHRCVYLRFHYLEEKQSILTILCTKCVYKWETRNFRLYTSCRALKRWSIICIAYYIMVYKGRIRYTVY